MNHCLDMKSSAVSCTRQHESKPGLIATERRDASGVLQKHTRKKLSGADNERKGKEEYLYSAILVRTHTLKALGHGSHSFTCK